MSCHIAVLFESARREHCEPTLPQFQDVELGDVLEGPNGGMRIEVLEPERVLAWRSGDGTWVWSFALYPQDGATRLVSRNRISMPDASLAKRLVSLLVMEPGSLVMERKLLLGIKERAGRLARQHEHQQQPD